MRGKENVIEQFMDKTEQYYAQRLMEKFPRIMEESEMQGQLLIEQGWKNRAEVTRFRYVCEDAFIQLHEVYLSDMINQIQLDEDAQIDDLLIFIRSKWEKTYQFIEENRQIFYEQTITKYVFPVLVNSRLNEGILDEIPHVKMEGISVTFHLNVEDSKPGTEDIIVSRRMMERWNIREEQLFEIAIHNPLFKAQYSVTSFDETYNHAKEHMQAEYGGLFVVEPPQEKGFILCTNNYPYVAAAILNQELVAELRKQMEGDFLVVFTCSSDVIIYPAEKDVNELQMDMEIMNEALGLMDGWITDEIFKYGESMEIQRVTFQAERIEKEPGRGNSMVGLEARR